MGKSWQWDVALFILASPVLAGKAVLGAVRRLKFLRLVVQPAINCGTCGGEISLVGFWKCSCGFTYRGHLLRFCPVCGSFPQMIRCYRCGATEKVRT